MSAYNYTWGQIKGVDIVLADLLGCWSDTVVILHLVTVTLLPSSPSSDFNWPNSSDLNSEQDKFHQVYPTDLVLKDGLWTN